MATLCRWTVRGFALLFALALFLFLVGTFGWFGQAAGPLAGVFLIPLGLPWNRFLDAAPEGLRPTLAVGAPLVNLAILVALCRWRRRAGG